MREALKRLDPLWDEVLPTAAGGRPYLGLAFGRRARQFYLLTGSTRSARKMVEVQKKIRMKTKTARAATEALSCLARRVENPAWLDTEPSGPGPNPPVVTRPAALPFQELSWENFERLCYRLAQKDGEVEKVWAYGAQGHEQLGIDVLVRMKDGTFVTWQSKRHQTFGPCQLKAAIRHFLDGVGLGRPRNSSWRSRAR